MFSVGIAQTDQRGADLDVYQDYTENSKDATKRRKPENHTLREPSRLTRIFVVQPCLNILLPRWIAPRLLYMQITQTGRQPSKYAHVSTDFGFGTSMPSASHKSIS
jgi:hypothetical protein